MSFYSIKQGVITYLNQVLKSYLISGHYLEIDWFFWCNEYVASINCHTLYYWVKPSTAVSVAKCLTSGGW